VAAGLWFAATPRSLTVSRGLWQAPKLSSQIGLAGSPAMRRRRRVERPPGKGTGPAPPCHPDRAANRCGL